MKRKIFVLFVLCSCISLLIKKTLAEGINDDGEGNTAQPILDRENGGGSNNSKELQTKTDELSLVENDGNGISQKVETEFIDLEAETERPEEIESSVGVLVQKTENTEEQNEVELKAHTIDAEVTEPVAAPDKVDSLNVGNIEVPTSIYIGVELESQSDINAPLTNEIALTDGSAEVEDIQVLESKDTEIQIEDLGTNNDTALSEDPQPIGEVLETESEDTTVMTDFIPFELTTTESDEITTEVPALTENEVEQENAGPLSDQDNRSTLSTTNRPQLACTTPGTFAEDSDCRSYTVCAQTTATTTNEFVKTQKSCPQEQAFHRELLRCTRDLSPCADAYKCEMEGTFSNPNDNSSYYWCVVSRINGGGNYHIYHVKCGNGQIYTPELGKCFVDMMNLQNLPLNYELYMSKSPDEECVREELKVLRAEEKAKLKEAKLREKIRKKYEKELMKKAAKEAKERAKLEGVALEAESESFTCTHEGSFAAAPESFYDYFVCLSKKGKLKGVGMKCAEGESFSSVKGLCTI